MLNIEELLVWKRENEKYPGGEFAAPSGVQNKELHLLGKPPQELGSFNFQR